MKLLDICEFRCRHILMFFFIFEFLVVLIDFFIIFMRSGVKFYVDLGGREVERTILDPFRENFPGDVSAPKFANTKYICCFVGKHE